MLNLIRNENMKIYRRTRTWSLFFILTALVLYINFIEWHSDGKDVIEQGWENVLIEENKSLNENLSVPEINDAEKQQIEEQLKINNYHLENEISPEIGTMWHGINGSAGLVLLITVFTIIIAGDIVAGEFTSGTIKLLLIRPASRMKILFSKYVSVIMFSFLLLFVLFSISFISNGFFYGFQDFALPLITTDEKGEVVAKSMYANLFMSYLYNGISTIMYVTMAFMISSAFRSGTMAIGFSIGASLGGNILLEAVGNYDWSKYLLFANTDLKQYLFGQPHQVGMTIEFSIIVLSIYYLIFIATAWSLFTKRDVIN